MNSLELNRDLSGNRSLIYPRPPAFVSDFLGATAGMLCTTGVFRCKDVYGYRTRGRVGYDYPESE